MYSFLYDCRGPWVVETKNIHDDFLVKMIAMYGDSAENSFFVLEGKNMQTWESLFSEFFEKMKFPSYFGFNIHALDECMRDLHEGLRLTLM